VERAKSLKVNSGMEPDADLGPVISKQVCFRIIPNLLCTTMIKSLLGNLLCSYRLRSECAD
jgi:hypothetical protein